MTRIAVYGALALTVSIGLTALVRAEDTHIAVRYSDLNLASEEGQAALAKRISRAADQACGGRPSPRDLASWQPFNDCRAQAIAAVQPRVQQVIAAAQSNTTIAIGGTVPPTKQ